jgi:hypothetical protein
MNYNIGFLFKYELGDSNSELFQKWKEDYFDEDGNLNEKVII